MTDPSPTWLRAPHPRPDADQVLVCFPHAAGSATFFRPWAQELEGYDVRAVQYPGRPDRMADPLPTDLTAMAQGVRADLDPLRARPIVLFGHSMGAVVAYEVARELRAAGVDVAHLVVSGARAAHDPQLAPAGAAQRSDESILASLARLGGTDAELFTDPLLAELAMPYVRADFVMFENYRHQPGPPLHCPITAVNGDDDLHVSDDRARRWAELTTAGFAQHTLPGEHFYLLQHPPYAVLEDLLHPTPKAAAS